MPTLHPFAAGRALARGTLLLAGLVLALLPAPPRRADAGATPPDPSPVTEDNLLARERFWPYRVALTAPWPPSGRGTPLRAGTVGVLIRVEPSGTARIDFSSDGKLDVPVGRTDLVERANRIRGGEIAKPSPNFVRAIATRLVDSAAGVPAALKPEVVAAHRGFLCVFADPDAEGFDALAAALAPLRDRHGVLTILFPQGEHPDVAMRERLRALGWTVPFPFDFLSEPYTRTLLAEGTPLPAVLLQTDEGRVVYQGPGRADAVPALVAALDAANGDAFPPPRKPAGPASRSEDVR